MEKKFLLITEKGLIGTKDLDTNEALAMLLHAYLDLWDDRKFNIDVLSAAEAIVDMLPKYASGNMDNILSDLDDLLKAIFDDNDDKDGGNG